MPLTHSRRSCPHLLPQDRADHAQGQEAAGLHVVNNRTVRGLPVHAGRDITSSVPRGHTVSRWPATTIGLASPVPPEATLAIRLSPTRRVRDCG